METIDVKVYIHAPAGKVWEILGDHEKYTLFEGVTKARLIRPGAEERNGVGAVREVKVGPISFIEEIMAYKPPWLLEYRVKKCSAPLRHQLGRVDLIPRGEGTEVHWLSRFEVPVPLVGGLLAKGTRLFFQNGFYEALMSLKESLEGVGR